MIQGNFIGIKENNSVFSILKTIQVKSEVTKATIKASSLGVYKIEINQKRVGDIFMAPFWTNYKKILQFQEYDVTSMLKAEECAIVMTIAKGWYSGRIPFTYGKSFYGEKTAGLLELTIEYIDGKTEVISTDTTWKAKETYIKDSEIYDGEVQDFISPLKELTPIEIPYNKEYLTPQQSEPVRNIEKVRAIKKLITPKGEIVYDFGQNLTGVVELNVFSPDEKTITILHAEVLDKDKNFYTENLRSAKAQNTYTFQGRKLIVPEFTFHGFRYVKIEGIDLPKDNVIALVRHSDIVRTGYIKTSSERINRLFENIVWSQRGNFLDIPSDCNQRDERLGWTGDANVFCKTSAFNYDVKLFYKKWLKDLRSEQAKTGELPVVVPNVLSDMKTSAIWADVITMMPYTLYKMYGDISFLQDNYEAMKFFLSAIEKNIEDGLIVKGYQYGDWLGLDKEESMPEIGPGATDSYFIANVFYSVSLDIVSKSAKILNQLDDEKKYKEKYENLILSIQNEYFTNKGRLVSETQTALTVALHFNVAPNKDRKRLASLLNENVKKHGYHLSTGFAGTPFLLFALSDNGYHDTAAKILLNRTYPSWLYEVDMGATTIWERWNGIFPDGSFYKPNMNSFNHYAYGSVGEFLYSRVAGIDMIDPGFKKVRIAPIPTNGLGSVKAEYDTQFGKIVSGYEYKDGILTIVCKIPEGIEAEIILPNSNEIITRGSGEYAFEIPYESLVLEYFTLDTILVDIIDTPSSLRAFNAVTDGMFSNPGLRAMKNSQLSDVAKYMGEDGLEKMEDIIAKANIEYSTN